MKSNIIYLSLANLILRVFVQGLLTVYPILIQNTGVSKSQIGYFLSATFIASLAGNWLSGKLTPVFIHPKTLLVLTALPICICIGLITLNHTYYSFLATALGLSFFVALNINASAILTGYFSSVTTIATNFGMVGISNIVATILGGFIIGPVMAYMGNNTAFILFAIVFLLSNFLFLGVDKPVISVIKSKQRAFKITRNLFFLLLGSLLIIMLIHLFKLSLSLQLKHEGYTIKSISLLSGLGALLVLPIPYLIAIWEKRFSPKNLLLSCYIVTILAFLILLITNNYYALAIAIAFISILAYASRTPVMSLMRRWYHLDTFHIAQTHYGSIAWLAAVIGYTLTGQLLDKTGFHTTIMTGGVIAVVAALILLFGVRNSGNVDTIHHSNLKS